MSGERGGITTSVTPFCGPMIMPVLRLSEYWSRRSRACRTRSIGIDAPLRLGRSGAPKRTMKATVTITMGTPTRANSKKPNALPPLAAAMSETMMLTGVPVRSSSDPADAANASGMSS